MKNYGFKQNNSYHTLFLKHNNKKVKALIIYVDNMIITEFEMKNLGGLKDFLGLILSRNDSKY